MADKNPNPFDLLFGVTTEALLIDSMQRLERMLDMWTACAQKEDDAEFAAHADRLFAPMLITRRLILDNPEFARQFLRAAPEAIKSLEENPAIKIVKAYRRDKGKAAREAQEAVDNALKKGAS